MNICTKCGQNPATKSWCKACTKDYTDQWYLRNKQKHQKLTSKRRNGENRTRFQAQSRNSRFKSKYGINEEQRNQLLENQQSKCAICGDHENETPKKTLAIDHCHTTGAVRGLLCIRCNNLLGFARDDISILETAIQYLNSQIK